jgi:hypothetical protein
LRMYDEIYGAVGLLTLRSAAVERSLDALCWVLRNRRRDQFETSGKPLTDILSALGKLASNEGEPLQTELLSIRARVNELKESRNHVIHGLWTGRDKPETWTVTRAMRRNPIPQAKEFTVDSVSVLAESYAEVLDRIIELKLPL